MRVITRDEVPGMNRIVVDGREHDLGILKHWRKEPHLNAILPRGLDVSLAWVNLQRGQQLDVHIHPVHSLVVCCQGSVRSIGDLEATLHEGDIIVIPTGYRHGFIGGDPDGFWGLSIQLESLALYEDLDSPLVTFVEPALAVEHVDAVTLLLQKNEYHGAEFARGRLFELLRSGYFADAARRAALLDVLEAWSSIYQKILFCRAAFTDHPKFAALARAHLADEIGHDESLRRGRDSLPIWDPVLDACAQWFVSRMLASDDAEQTVLVHLVLERAASAFYGEFKAAIPPGADGAAHFDQHADAAIDIEHMKMGLDVLRGVPLRDHGSLVETQRRGWTMFNTMFARMAELVVAR
jgi:quercetin dioxygenase-like cupin family protein